MRRSLAKVAAGVVLVASAGAVSAARPEPGSAPAVAEQQGGVTEFTQHRRSGVVTASMANGALLHYRRITALPGQVEVAVSFFGGRLFEDAATHGTTRLAAEVLEQSLEGLKQGAASEKTNGGGDSGPPDVHFDALPGPDVLGLRIWGSAVGVERGAELAGEFFKKPRVSTAIIERARGQLTNELGARDQTPSSVVGQALVDLIYPPEETRVQAVEPRDISGLGEQAVEAWMNRHFLGSAPIEVAVVGDIALDRAVRIGEALVGGLPARARVVAAAQEPLRTIIRAAGPFERTVTLPTPSGKAVVLAGFLGIDSASTPVIRQMRAASRVLQGRVRDRLVRAGMVGKPEDCNAGMFLSPFNGFGMVLLSAEVEDDRAHDANTILNDEIDRVSSDGPSAEELSRSAEELAKEVEKYDTDARYWAGLLARCAAHGIDPDEIARGAAFYRSLTPAAVLEPLGRLWTPRSRVGLVIRAKEPEPAAADQK